MNISDYILVGLTNRLGKINRYTMVHSVKLKFEIDDKIDKFLLKTTLEKQEMVGNDLFVVCNIVKRESSINTLQVVFDISATDIEKSKLNFFRLERFYLLYGNIIELLDAKLPNDYGIIGRVLISPKILIRKIMEHPLQMVMSKHFNFFHKVHKELPLKDSLTTRRTSQRTKELIDENIKVFNISLPDDFHYSNDSITDLCRRFSGKCVLSLNCKIGLRPDLYHRELPRLNKHYITTPNLDQVREASVKVILSIIIQDENIDEFYGTLRDLSSVYRYICEITKKFPNTLSLNIEYKHRDANHVLESKHLDEDEFTEMVRPLRNLTTLHLSHITIPFKAFIEYIQNINLLELRLCDIHLEDVDPRNFDFGSYCENFKYAMRNVETFELKGFCYIKNTENWFAFDVRFWEILKDSPKLKSLYFTNHLLSAFEQDEEEQVPFALLKEIEPGLRSLTQLTFLSLSQCQYNVRTINYLLGPALVNLVNLVELDLSSTRDEEAEQSMNSDMINAFIPFLKELGTLNVLNVSNNHLLKEDDIQLLYMSLPRVKIIY
jgi:hypothetical protein